MRHMTIVNNKYFGIIILILFMSVNIVVAQDNRTIELDAQEILARADLYLNYPNGLLKGKLMQVYPNGESFTVNFEVSVADQDYLFAFSSKRRGKQMMVLYNLKGEDIWVYDILSLKLFHKIDIDKYDPILNTNYNFIDLSNADLQSNYTGEILGDAYIKGKEAFKVSLQPIDKKGVYGKLTLYSSKTDYMPLRIDYHDQDGVIMKTMSISRVGEYNGRKFPVRYDMMNVRKGHLTIMNFHRFETKVTFPSKIFRHENFGKD